MANANTDTLLIIFIGITAVAVLLQAGVLLGLFLSVRKAVQAGKEQADEYRAKITLVLDGSSQLIGLANGLIGSAQSLIKQVQPRLESAAAELENMARDIHVEANKLQASVDAVTQKALSQVERVDGMTTSVLNGLDRFGAFLNEAVNMPIRQVNGIVAAAKAVMDALRAPAPARTHPRPVSRPLPVGEDKDLFV